MLRSLLLLLMFSAAAAGQNVSVRLTRGDDSTRAGRARIEIRGWQLLAFDGIAFHGDSDEVELPATIGLVGGGRVPVIFAALDTASGIRIAVEWTAPCPKPRWLPSPFYGFFMGCKSSVHVTSIGAEIELLVDDQGPHVRAFSDRRCRMTLGDCPQPNGREPKRVDRGYFASGVGGSFDSEQESTDARPSASFAPPFVHYFSCAAECMTLFADSGSSRR
jgi:hypothetical protein